MFDIWTCTEEIKQLHKTANEIDPNIQVASIKHQNRFLVTILITYKTLCTYLYCKPTDTHMYLNKT